MTVPFTFGTQAGPIPLSELDADFAAPVAYANTAGTVINPVQANITSLGTLVSLSVAGNVNSANAQIGILTANTIHTSGNILTNNSVSAYGNVTAGNVIGNVVSNSISATGLIVTTNNLIGGNIYTGGIISAVGSIQTQGIVSAIGNIVTASYFVGNFRGNVVGNVSVGGSNTQVLFNSNGNIGASPGLTFTTSPNALGVLGTISASGNITTVQGNVTAGNLLVNGATQLVGLVTAPTAPNGTANNQVATTAFVSTTVGTLGTMASQNAVSVAITGGTIGNGILTLASISNSNISNTRLTATTLSNANITVANITTANIANTAITTSTIDQVTMVGGWSVIPSGNTLYFNYNGSNIAKLDSAGNFTTKGNVTAFALSI